MVQGSLIRIIGAFVAGLVLALASAVVYVRMHDRQPVPQVATEIASVPAQTPTPASPPPAIEPEPQQAPEPERMPVKERRSPAVVIRKKPIQPSKPAIVPREEPVQVVQNTSPAGPSYPTTSQAQAAPETPTPQPAAPPPPQPHVVELAAGTNLVVRLAEPLSTDDNYTNDAFRATLDEPIIREGFIIAEKGSKVLGRVVEADKAGRVRGVASLRIALSEINTTDGQRISVSTNQVEKQGAKGAGKDAAKIAGGAALGAIIGALGGGGKGAAIGAGAGGAAGTGVVLATRGKAAVIPNESRLTFQLATPVTITEKLHQ